jgi:hypothetical protein
MPQDLDQRIATLTNPTGLAFKPIDTGAPCGKKMKGFPLLHLLKVMEQQGPDVAARWRATLPEAVRPQTERKALTSVAWVPVEYYFSGVAWLAQERSGKPRGAIALGHAAASDDIGSFFRFVLSGISPATVLSLSGRFWRSYFDFGALVVSSATTHSCIAEVREWPLLDEAAFHEIAGSMVAWMEASRGRDARLTRLELADRTTLVMHASWT